MSSNSIFHYTWAQAQTQALNFDEGVKQTRLQQQIYIHFRLHLLQQQGTQQVQTHKHTNAYAHTHLPNRGCRFS